MVDTYVSHHLKTLQTKKYVKSKIVFIVYSTVRIVKSYLVFIVFGKLVSIAFRIVKARLEGFLCVVIFHGHVWNLH
jgi:hypothetical protein